MLGALLPSIDNLVGFIKGCRLPGFKYFSPLSDSWGALIPAKKAYLVGSRLWRILQILWTYLSPSSPSGFEERAFGTIAVVDFDLKGESETVLQDVSFGWSNIFPQHGFVFSNL